VNDIFLNRVNETIEEFTREDVEAKVSFLDSAEKNPVWAIEHRAAHLVACEEALVTIARVKACLNAKSRRKAVLELVREVTEELAESATDNRSACQFSNGFEWAKRLGVARALRSLRLLADHEFI
jgi:hypothetical protein